MKLPILLVLLSLMCLIASGCGPLGNLQTKTEYIVSEPGNPLETLDQANSDSGKDVTVKGRDMKTGAIIQQQKINGWPTMPPTHWRIIQDKLNGVSKYEKDHSIHIDPFHVEKQ